MTAPNQQTGKKLVALSPWVVLSIVISLPPYEFGFVTGSLGLGVLGGLWLTLLFPGDTDAPPNRKMD